MKRNHLILLSLLSIAFLFYPGVWAQENLSSDKNLLKMQRLATKWYGEGTKITGVKKWKAIRITAQDNDTDGERRWLVLFPEKQTGKYNAYIVSMMVYSEKNNSATMSEEAKKALLSISKPTVVSGISDDTRLNDLVLPYLFPKKKDFSKKWLQGTYYYSPVENISEYLLEMKAKKTNANSIPLAASVYIDENGFLVHRKVTAVLTISRGEEKAP